MFRELYIVAMTVITAPIRTHRFRNVGGARQKALILGGDEKLIRAKSLTVSIAGMGAPKENSSSR